MIPDDFFPAQAKTHERFILLLHYGHNITDPHIMAFLLRYKDLSPIYRTLKKYRDDMKGKRVAAYRQRHVGKAFIGL